MLGEGLSKELTGVGQRDLMRDWEVAGVQGEKMDYLWRKQMD